MLACRCTPQSCPLWWLAARLTAGDLVTVSRRMDYTRILMLNKNNLTHLIHIAGSR